MVVDQVSQEISKQFELQHKWNVRVCFFHFKVTYEYEIEYVNKYIVQSTTGTQLSFDLTAQWCTCTFYCY